MLDIVMSVFHALFTGYLQQTLMGDNMPLSPFHNEKNEAFKKLVQGHSVDKRLSQDQPESV